MRDVNKVVLRGVVSDPPRIQTFEEDRKLVSLNVKTATVETMADGSARERPAWHQVSVSGRKNAEIAEGLVQDSPVYVEGELRTRKYTNREGHEVYATEVQAGIVRAVEDGAHINRSLVLGNIGRVDDLRSFSWGQLMSFSVATSSGWTPRGRDEEITEWHRIVAFGDLAEDLSRRLQKGERVLVEGRVRSRSYTDRNGVQRRSTETEATSVFASGRRAETYGSEASGGQEYRRGSRADWNAQVERQRNAAATGVDTSDDEDEVPF